MTATLQKTLVLLRKEIIRLVAAARFTAQYQKEVMLLAVTHRKLIVKRMVRSGLVCLFTAACSSGRAAEGEGGSGGAAGANGTPSTCTSQMYWTGGDKGSELMHPGGTCLTCHSNSPEAPKFSLAGTVYPTAHEPDDCNGFNGFNGLNGFGGSSGVTVVITDAMGKELPPVPVNEVGNFHYQDRIAAPFRVKVVASGKETVMSASPENGECNSCHTRSGANSAPGRIVAP
jgi:hypothetical protein